MHQTIRCLLVAAFSLSNIAWAAEFRSSQELTTVLFDAPSIQASKRFVVGSGYPFEVIVKLDRWTKVRDNHGDISWIEAKNLTEKRMLIVIAPGAEIRDKPALEGGIVFRAEKDLLLEMTEMAKDGWVKIRHRDGQTGYITTKQVWGL